MALRRHLLWTLAATCLGGAAVANPRPPYNPGEVHGNVHARGTYPRHLRRGGRYFDPWLLGQLEDPTASSMVKLSFIDGRVLEPIDRVKTLIGNLRHGRDPRARVDAIEDLLWFSSERVETELIRALRDPHRRVRERAVIALGEVGTKVAIRPLIHAMFKSPGPIRDTIDHTLFKLTGESYGRRGDRWRRWLEANEDLIE